MSEILRVTENVQLNTRCSLGLGGPADYFSSIETQADLESVAEQAVSRQLPLKILGGGSNLVIADAGVRGWVAQMALKGRTIDGENASAIVTAAAGETWDDLVAFTVRSGLSGLECLSGIPGLVGATPIQNVGAYGQEVSQTIEYVDAFDLRRLQKRRFSNQECQFRYRSSLFKTTAKERFVVTEVAYRLRAGGAAAAVNYKALKEALAGHGISSPTLMDVRRHVLEIRREKSMVLSPADPNRRSCGSFFVNPCVSSAHAQALRDQLGEKMPAFAQSDGTVKLSAAWLIEKAGFKKGWRHGNVGISSGHSLALVCHDRASAVELVRFARQVRERVRSRFGVVLVPEPVMWGFAELDDGLPALDAA